MFQVTEGKWCQIQNNFTENVKDAIGASVNEELFNAGRQSIAGLQRQYVKSEADKNQINALLMELRSIV
ncbi:MAG: hypothetical protein J6K04_02485 [Lachnospiraceae bacterium]|nr:hypothetical protein [Lachnospiraceae bacterium]